MISQDNGLEFRGLAGRLTEEPFDAASLGTGIAARLTRDRHGWLTTVSSARTPVPMPVWFHFDGNRVIVYSQPSAKRMSHIVENPDVAMHLESDGLGGGIVIVGGTASVTADGVDPREDRGFWAKYHVEAEALGLTEAIASFSTRIAIVPTTIWTSLPG